MNIRFQHLEALHWLWLVLAMAVVVGIGFHLRRRRLARFARDAVLGRLLPAASLGRQVARGCMVVLALLCLVAALIDPRWGESYEEVQQQGIDIMAVLDVSRSMLAEDATPNRLERAKTYISDLASQLTGDRIGLITFAGAPAVRCPLTVDYGSFRLSLNEVGPESAARGGSLLGDALRLAADSFTDEVKDYKAVIIFTDGEDHGSYPLEAARQLFDERGIRVYTVGLGDDQRGARIPVEVGGQQVYLTYEGEEVWSKMNAGMLREMAIASGGAFIPAGTLQVDFPLVYTERIEPATKREFETARIRRYHARYQWFAGLALLLLMIESAVPDRRSNAGRPRNSTEDAR